jgi:putative endonuclease
LVTYFVYILKSEKDGSFYTGFTQDLARRLQQHNIGKVKATRYKRPFRLVYNEAHPNATEARQREYYIKSQKSRKFIEGLIKKRANSSAD